MAGKKDADRKMLGCSRSGAVRSSLFLIALAGAGVMPLRSVAAAPPRGGPPPAEDASSATTSAPEEIVVTGHSQRGTVRTDVPPEVSLNTAVIQSLGAADLTEVFRELAPEIGTSAATSTTPAGWSPPTCAPTAMAPISAW